MNIPIYYDCNKCEGKFPHKDYDHESGLCKDCLTAKKDAVAKLHCSAGLSFVLQAAKHRYKCHHESVEYDNLPPEKREYRKGHRDAYASMIDVINEAIKG